MLLDPDERERLRSEKQAKEDLKGLHDVCLFGAFAVIVLGFLLLGYSVQTNRVCGFAPQDAIQIPEVPAQGF